LRRPCEDSPRGTRKSVLLDNWKLGNLRLVYRGEMNEPLEDAVEKTLGQFGYYRVPKDTT